MNTNTSVHTGQRDVGDATPRKVGSPLLTAGQPKDSTSRMPSMAVDRHQHPQQEALIRLHSNTIMNASGARSAAVPIRKHRDPGSSPRGQNPAAAAAVVQRQFSKSTDDNISRTTPNPGVISFSNTHTLHQQGASASSGATNTNATALKASPQPTPTPGSFTSTPSINSNLSTDVADLDVRGFKYVFDAKAFEWRRVPVRVRVRHPNRGVGQDDLHVIFSVDLLLGDGPDPSVAPMLAKMFRHDIDNVSSDDYYGEAQSQYMCEEFARRYQACAAAAIRAGADPSVLPTLPLLTHRVVVRLEPSSIPEQCLKKRKGFFSYHTHDTRDHFFVMEPDIGTYDLLGWEFPPNEGLGFGASGDTFLPRADKSWPKSKFLELADAFSHFTYADSQHTMLVCGLRRMMGYLLDPLINALDRKQFGVGNGGLRAISSWSMRHNCNDICRALGLSPRSEQMGMMRQSDVASPPFQRLPPRALSLQVRRTTPSSSVPSHTNHMQDHGDNNNTTSRSKHPQQDDQTCGGVYYETYAALLCMDPSASPCMGNRPPLVRIASSPATQAIKAKISSPPEDIVSLPQQLYSIPPIPLQSVGIGVPLWDVAASALHKRTVTPPPQPPRKNSSAKQSTTEGTEGPSKRAVVPSFKISSGSPQSECMSPSKRSDTSSKSNSSIISPTVGRSGQQGGPSARTRCPTAAAAPKTPTTFKPKVIVSSRRPKQQRPISGAAAAAAIGAHSATATTPVLCPQSAPTVSLKPLSFQNSALSSGSPRQMQPIHKGRPAVSSDSLELCSSPSSEPTIRTHVPRPLPKGKLPLHKNQQQRQLSEKPSADSVVPSAPSSIETPALSQQPPMPPAKNNGSPTQNISPPPPLVIPGASQSSWSLGLRGGGSGGTFSQKPPFVPSTVSSAPPVTSTPTPRHALRSQTAVRRGSRESPTTKDSPCAQRRSMSSCDPRPRRGSDTSTNLIPSRPAIVCSPSLKVLNTKQQQQQQPAPSSSAGRQQQRSGDRPHTHVDALMGETVPVPLETPIPEAVEEDVNAAYVFPAKKRVYCFKTGSWKTIPTRIRIVSPDRGVAQGGMRVCFEVHEVNQRGDRGTRNVAKMFRRSVTDVVEEDYYTASLVQTLSGQFALDFNERLETIADTELTVSHKRRATVVMIPCCVVYFERADIPAELAAMRTGFFSYHTSDTYRMMFTMEPMLRGGFTKYNNNCGASYRYNEHPLPFEAERQRMQIYEAAEALTHFSLIASGGGLLVCDIQGVGSHLTDPEVHTYDGEGLGIGNLGRHGITQFIFRHKCNSVCKAAGLVSLAGRPPVLTEEVKKNNTYLAVLHKLRSETAKPT